MSEQSGLNSETPEKIGAKSQNEKGRAYEKEKKENKLENKSEDAEKIQRSEVKIKIDDIESKKKNLISDIRMLNRELKLKSMEYEAVKKLAEKATGLGIEKLLRELRSLEFKMSTQTINSSSEKKFMKRVIELERELAKVRPYLNARKRLVYLEERIKKVNEGIVGIEKKLNAMRSDLNELYRKYKMERRAKKSGVKMSESKEDDFMTLEDVVEIEDEQEDKQ